MQLPEEFFRLSITTMMVVLGLRFSGAQKIDYCTQDVSPCICNNDQNGDPSMSCINTNITDVVEVFDRVFFLFLRFFELIDFEAGEDGVIPENLLKNTDVNTLTIQCKESIPLQIANNSFKGQKTFTTNIDLTGCNLSDTTLGFLEGFVSLKELKMASIPNMGSIFPNFPIRLSAMISFTIDRCLGWGKLAKTPRTMYQGSLKALYVTNSNDMNDEAMSIAMDWALHSFNTTLESIYVYNNSLKKMPHQLQSFIRLKYLDLKNNFFPIITNASFVFKETTIRLLSLSQSKVEEILPGAFQGNFEKSVIDLQGNYVRKIESTVFKEILLAAGTIDVKDNPINCEDDPCHLAWIYNENLLSQVINAQCSNGTYLKDLDPNVFVECYVSSTTESSCHLEASSSQKTFQELTSSTTSWLNIDTVTPSTANDTNFATDSGFTFTTFAQVSSLLPSTTDGATNAEPERTDPTPTSPSPLTSKLPMPSNGVPQKQLYSIHFPNFVIQLAFSMTFFFFTFS